MEAFGGFEISMWRFFHRGSNTARSAGRGQSSPSTETPRVAAPSAGPSAVPSAERSPTWVATSRAMQQRWASPRREKGVEKDDGKKQMRGRVKEKENGHGTSLAHQPNAARAPVPSSSSSLSSAAMAAAAAATAAKTRAWQLLSFDVDDDPAAAAVEEDEIKPYDVLGVERDASADVIKKAYRMLALKLHPDRHAGKDAATAGEAERRFAELNLAHALLSDPYKRRQLDSGRRVREIMRQDGDPKRKSAETRHVWALRRQTQQQQQQQQQAAEAAEASTAAAIVARGRRAPPPLLVVALLLALLVAGLVIAAFLSAHGSTSSLAAAEPPRPAQHIKPMWPWQRTSRHDPAIETSTMHATAGNGWARAKGSVALWRERFVRHLAGLLRRLVRRVMIAAGEARRARGTSIAHEPQLGAPGR